MSRKIACVQQNLQKCELAHIELINNLEGLENYLCLIQEPYKRRNRLVNIPTGATCIPSPQVVEGARAAVYASEGCKLVELAHLCSRDSAVGLLNISGSRVVVASLYLDVNLVVNQAWIADLFAEADKYGCPILLGMDSNAHSRLFGPTQNSRGDDLEELIATFSLQVENRCHTPTYRRPGASSCIDVTLTRDMAGRVMNWRINLKDWRCSPSLRLSARRQRRASGLSMTSCHLNFSYTKLH